MAHVREMDAPRRRAVGPTASSWRRYLYFGLASLWGYGVGIVMVVAALSRGDSRAKLDPETWGWLAGGSLLAGAGAWIVAGAYRASRRRHS